MKSNVHQRETIWLYVCLSGWPLHCFLFLFIYLFSCFVVTRCELVVLWCCSIKHPSEKKSQSSAFVCLRKNVYLWSTLQKNDDKSVIISILFAVWWPVAGSRLHSSTFSRHSSFQEFRCLFSSHFHLYLPFLLAVQGCQLLQLGLGDFFLCFTRLVFTGYMGEDRSKFDSIFYFSLHWTVFFLNKTF